MEHRKGKGYDVYIVMGKGVMDTVMGKCCDGYIVFVQIPDH